MSSPSTVVHRVQSSGHREERGCVVLPAFTAQSRLFTRQPTLQLLRGSTQARYFARQQPRAWSRLRGRPAKIYMNYAGNRQQTRRPEARNFQRLALVGPWGACVGPIMALAHARNERLRLPPLAPPSSLSISLSLPHTLSPATGPPPAVARGPLGWDRGSVTPAFVEPCAHVVDSGDMREGAEAEKGGGQLWARLDLPHACSGVWLVWPAPRASLWKLRLRRAMPSVIRPLCQSRPHVFRRHRPLRTAHAVVSARPVPSRGYQKGPISARLHMHVCLFRACCLIMQKRL